MIHVVKKQCSYSVKYNRFEKLQNDIHFGFIKENKSL